MEIKLFRGADRVPFDVQIVLQTRDYFKRKCNIKFSFQVLAT